MLRNSCVQQFHKISNWTILINREVGGNVKAFKIKLTPVQLCLLQISRNVAIFERLPNEWFQVFFQDFENKSHTYLKKTCILLLMVIFSSGRVKRRAELHVEISPVCCVGLSLARDAALGGVRCRTGVCREEPPWPCRCGCAGPGLTNCCSLWCSHVPANCCSSHPAASRGSEEMLCCQCWKSVHFDPAVFLICQRLKTLIELSCAGSCVGQKSCCLPCGWPHTPGCKTGSCTISPALTASAL